MSNLLAAGKTLELVDGLKQAVQGFGARAEKLNEDYRLRTAKDRQRTDSAIQQQNRELEVALAEAETDYQRAKTAALASYERRKVRIGKAYQSTRERALRAVEDQAGARKYQFQKQILQAERGREAGLAAIAAQFQEFRQTLATEQAKLEVAERAAQRAFRGYGAVQRRFLKAYEAVEVDSSRDHQTLLRDLRDSLARADGALHDLRKVFLFQLFKFRVFWTLVILSELLTPWVLQQRGVSSFSYLQAVIAMGLSTPIVLACRALAQAMARSATDKLCDALSRARRSHDIAFETSESHRQQELERVKREFQEAGRSVDQQLKRVQAEAAEGRVAQRMESDERTVSIAARHEALHRTRLARLDQNCANKVKALTEASAGKKQALSDSAAEQQTRLAGDYQAGSKTLEAEWKNTVSPIYQSMDSANMLAERLFPPWDNPGWMDWKPPTRFSDSAQFGQLNVDLEKLCQGLPKDKRLALPGPPTFTVPLCLAYPDQGSILFETGATGHDRAVIALNSVILRLLSSSPPGRLNFTIIDPVGLGQNFAGIMHLADYEEQLINSRIWTQSGQIEQKLADLNEHMEKVIQMYLRNEYSTIAEYNEQAGVIAEKYYFLVIADFPVNFTDVAAKRLMSIAASGARCGVYTLILWDQRQPLPQDFLPDELRKSSVCLSAKGNDFILTGRAQPGAELVLEAPPTPEFAIDFVNQVGRASRDSSRVEVPFSQVTPPEDEIWSEDTATELRVPIGRTGATKLQYLAIGKGTRQHGLIAGKTGSGKSTLFHVIITNLSLWCSPEQVEFYLVDFKKGVEFKCYATRHLPHARVVAIESDREFGLSVLQRVDDELRHRGDLFRQLGVQDLAGYKRAGGKESVPRSLLLIDEFQEFFVEDDRISQTASLLLDRIVRQGRAFGIHVLLGSQTLGGAYTVARTTLGQMVVRIALQCNEADAYLIMDESNAAPRLLSRPGEGIYNDMAGALEGNSPFQVVWLPDHERDEALAKVRARADQLGAVYPGPIVFEGNAPADVAENALLRGLLEAPAIQPPAAPRIWLGAPNSIKGPTEVTFTRQSGNNLVIVGQRDESTLAMLCVALVSLAAQYQPSGVRLVLLDGTAPGSPHREFLERTLQAIPHPITLVKPNELATAMSEVAAELKQRAESPGSESAPPVFLFIHGLQKHSRLRYEEDFSFSSSDSSAEPNPAATLNSIVCEGARLGLHVIATSDSYNNVNRYFSRKALSEFEMRVLFQMSANDSASLIDNPKASMLGLHRAIYCNAQEGYLETFRPYALPGADWLSQAARNLARLVKQPAAASSPLV